MPGLLLSANAFCPSQVEELPERASLEQLRLPSAKTLQVEELPERASPMLTSMKALQVEELPEISPSRVKARQAL